MTENDEPEPQTVINSHVAWGKDRHATDALCQMLGNWRSDFQETEQIHLVRYTGTLKELSLFGHVAVDGEILEAKALKVDGKKLDRLSSLIVDTEVLADEVLAEAEEVDLNE